MNGPHALPAIEAANLSRIFETRRERTVHALRNVDLTVPRGECLGLLGPNGAGKSTLIKILTTLLLPTTGRALVAGFDVARDPLSVRHRINLVSGGDSSGYGILTVRETLHLFARFYGVSWTDARRRADDLMEITGLGPKADTRLSNLSTGMKQKVNFARGFMSDPEIVFLDEPTLGLDVEASRAIRSFVSGWVRERPERTVLLTTHYMAEADELCDRVAIIDHGRILALDSPRALKRSLPDESGYELHLSGSPPPTEWTEHVRGVRTAIQHTDPGSGAVELRLTVTDDHVIGEVLRVLKSMEIEVVHLTKRDPTLESVFVQLVGRGLDVDDAEVEAR